MLASHPSLSLPKNPSYTQKLRVSSNDIKHNKKYNRNDWIWTSDRQDHNRVSGDNNSHSTGKSLKSTLDLASANQNSQEFHPSRDSRHELCWVKQVCVWAIGRGHDHAATFLWWDAKGLIWIYEVVWIGLCGLRFCWAENEGTWSSEEGTREASMCSCWRKQKWFCRLHSQCNYQCFYMNHNYS